MLFFDAHCDTLSVIYDLNISIYNNTCHVDIKRLKQYEKYIQVFAIWSNPKYSESNLYTRFIAIYKNFLNEISKNSNYIELGISSSEKISSIISIEGLDFIINENQLSIIDKLYRLGVKSIGLTWNYRNNIACGILEEKDTGLTDLGKKTIKKMNELGILIDVSHLSQKSFWQVLELTQKPVIASHSNSYKVCRNKRNLTDEQFKAILNNKGAVGVNFYKDFLTENKKCTIKDIVNHIEYFLSLGGKDNIGIGTDFDGMSHMPEKVKGCENMELVINTLLKNNYSEDLVKKIIGKNIYNLYKDIIY